MLASQSSTDVVKDNENDCVNLKKTLFLSSNMLGYGSQEKENELSPLS